MPSTNQAVFDTCLKLYGEATQEYAKQINTPTGIDAFRKMCNCQDMLWQAAKDLADE